MEKINEALLDGESIIKTYHPNKKRFINVSYILVTVILSIFIAAFLIIGGIHFAKTKTYEVFLYLGVLSFILIVLDLLYLVELIYSYKNTVYYITNKRLIISSGFLFKELKFVNTEKIYTTSIHTTFVDKIYRELKTGDIYFYLDENQKDSISFIFKNLDNPLEIHKEIQDLINKE